jgi:hypothetical protein
MSRDFILVFSGGVVSLMTTLVVLFVMDYFYRRDQKNKADRPVQVAADHEDAGKNVAVLTPLAKGSDQTAAVDQIVKPHDADSSPRQPVIVQTEKAGVGDAAARKPSDNQTTPSSAATSVTIKSAVDAGLMPRSEDPPSQKQLMDPKPDLRVDEIPVPAPTVVRQTQPVVVDRAPDPKGDDHSVEQPKAEDKSLPKTVETAAHEPTVVRESQPAAGGDVKPRPPHMVPPEKIKKKAREENPARPQSKEHEG